MSSSSEFPEISIGMSFFPGETSGEIKSSLLTDSHFANTHIIRQGSTVLAITGPCFADEADINSALEIAHENGTATRLPGSATTIAIDGANSSISVAQNLSGNRPIYYRETGSGIRVGNRASDLNEQPIADLGFAATVMVLGGSEGSLLGSRSSVAGVNRLEPGHTLAADENGVRIFDNTKNRSQVSSLEEGAELLRFALSYAISKRFDSEAGVSADMSGGLDSATIASIVLRKGLTTGFKTYSATPIGIDTEDVRYTEAFRKIFPKHAHLNFDMETAVREFTFTDARTLDVPDDLAIAQLVDPDSVNFITAYNRFILENGGGPIHLTGHGGDEVVTSGPHYLIDLVQHGKFWRLLQDGVDVARLKNIRPADAVRQAALLAVTSPEKIIETRIEELRNPITTTGTRNFTLAPWQIRHEAAALLTPDARHFLADYIEDLVNSRDDLSKRFTLPDIIRQDRLRLSGFSWTAVNEYSRISGQPLTLHAPFLDDEVIEACGAIPAELLGSPHEFKRVLTLAFGDTIPPEFTQRRTKGSYNRARASAFRSSLPAIREILESSQLVDAGFFDKQAILNLIAADGVMDADAYRALTQFVTIERWYQKITGKSSVKPVVPKIAINEKTKTLYDTFPRPEETIPTEKREYIIPGHIKSVVFETGGIVLLNEQTMRYWVLDPSWSRMLRILNDFGTVEKAVEAIIGANPDIDHEALAESFERLLDSATNYGVLEEDDHAATKHTIAEAPRKADFISDAAVQAIEPATTIKNIRTYVTALRALRIWKKLERSTPNQKLNFLHDLQERKVVKDASEEEAADLLQATQQLITLGRLACSEQAFITCVAGALGGRRVEYHLGVSDLPLGFHAWAAVNGKPIRGGRDGIVEGEFQSFFV